MSSVRDALLRFYDAHARELPWRQSRDPYAIWVSEVMLQQTRVDTVIDYYTRFMQRFPDAPALARASEDEVMAAWSGLGYYRRARLLHAGVREVVERYGGQVPEDADARRGLPGVGRYTAGAIGSIAFDKREPIVDGNVTRVLCRLHATDAPPESSAVQKRLWEEAARLVQGPRPGDLNQALMELGATVCTKANPRCQACPLRANCRAHRTGRAAELPRARVRAAPRPVQWVALRAERGRGEARAVVLARGQGSLFGGLWNLPLAEGHGRAAAVALASELGISGRLSAAPLGELAHVLSHRKLHVQVYAVRSAALTHPTDGLRAVAWSQLPSLGVSQLTRKALSL